MGWKACIEAKLKEVGPCRTGELIAALGFSVESTWLDLETRCIEGLKPWRVSFVDSAAQRVLGKMVERGEVIWQRAANMDNWYRLPGQRFPRIAAPRRRTLKKLAGEVLELLLVRAPKIAACRIDEWKEAVRRIGPDDCWVEIYPCVLSAYEDGWELADGDPVCNWAGNTFTRVYPMDVEAAVIVRRIWRELRREEMSIK